MSSTSSNPLPISLPRFSPAALLLALALAAMLSMVVGIAAYTVHTGSGISQSDLAAAQHNAYQSGHDAGYTAGLAKGKDTGQNAGYRQGKHDGQVAGIRRRAGQVDRLYGVCEDSLPAEKNACSLAW